MGFILGYFDVDVEKKELIYTHSFPKELCHLHAFEFESVTMPLPDSLLFIDNSAGCEWRCTVMLIDDDLANGNVTYDTLLKWKELKTVKKDAAAFVGGALE